MTRMSLSGRILLLTCLALLALPALAQEPAPPARYPDSAVSFQLPASHMQGVVVTAVRPLLEGLGCSVQWDSNSREIVATRGATVLQLAPGRKELVVDTRTIEMPMAPDFYEGRLLAPAAPLVQALGASLTYDQESSRITVVMAQEAPPVASAKALQITVNGQPVALPLPPRWEKGRIIAPLRAVFSAVGAEVGWDAVKREVVVKLGENVVRLQEGKVLATANGQPLTLSSPPERVGTILVGPVAALASALGVGVMWIGAEQTVSLTTAPAALASGAPTEAQAVSLAIEYLKTMGQYPLQVTKTETSLDQAPANGYWEAVAHGTALPTEPVVRPAWIVKFTYTGLSPEDFKEVYVDAEDGKILGGTQSR